MTNNVLIYTILLIHVVQDTPHHFIHLHST